MSTARKLQAINCLSRMTVSAAFLLFSGTLASAGGKETDGSNAPSADNPGSALVLPMAPKDPAKDLNDLYDRLAKATNAADADVIKSQIREHWNVSGSPTIDLLLSRDAQAAMAKDTALRRRLLDAAIHLAPAFSESWNRRAELDYSDQQFGAAMADLGHVLSLEPRQFDALEGLATLMKEIGRNDLALKAFRQLKTIDPTSATIKTQIEDLAKKVEGQPI